MENIYPEKYIPDENVIAYGRVRIKNININKQDTYFLCCKYIYIFLGDGYK